MTCKSHSHTDLTKPLSNDSVLAVKDAAYAALMGIDAPPLSQLVRATQQDAVCA